MTKNPIALTRNVDGRRYASPELIEEYEHMAPILGAVGAVWQLAKIYHASTELVRESLNRSGFNIPRDMRGVAA